MTLFFFIRIELIVFQQPSCVVVLKCRFDSIHTFLSLSVINIISHQFHISPFIMECLRLSGNYVINLYVFTWTSRYLPPFLYSQLVLFFTNTDFFIFQPVVECL